MMPAALLYLDSVLHNTNIMHYLRAQLSGTKHLTFTNYAHCHSFLSVITVDLIFRCFVRICANGFCLYSVLV